MTSCAECLTSLATTRIADIDRNSALVAHCMTCENCARVASDLRVAEQRLAVTLAELRPQSLSETVASEAILGFERSRRRTTARLFRGALAMLALLILGTFVNEKRAPRPALETQTITLKCLSPEAASTVVTPYLRSSGSAVWSISGLHAITIRAVHVELERAISQIDAIQSQSCGLPDPGGGSKATPGAEIPGKD